MTTRYIFCISPGRCGTRYLSSLLERAEGVCSVHEGLPLMNGEPMVQFNDGDERMMSELLPGKVAAMDGARGHGVYSETNHTFIKGWGWLLPGNVLNESEIGVVILHRDVEEIAQSLLRIREVPGESAYSRAWYLEPGARTNLHDPVTKSGYLDLCRWYVREIYMRAERYRDRFPRIRYFDCTLDELNSISGVERMFAAFGLESRAGLGEVVGIPSNRKLEWPDLEVEHLEEVPDYANPDELAGEEQERLISRMLAWMSVEMPSQVKYLEAATGAFNTRYFSATRCLAESESSLEDAFQYRLRFTETSRMLANELVYAINPDDPCFLFMQRVTDPFLAYRYDFNMEPRPEQNIRLFGLESLQL